MSAPDFICIENAELYAPEARGRVSVLLAGNRVLRVGPDALPALNDFAVERIDARGYFLLPGLIDPHEHLIGGSGENQGFASQSPEITLAELIRAGITTVVGCLGVDTTTKTMPALLAKVKGLNEEGLTAYLYSGGYNVPSTTLTGSLRTDIMFCSEVIGAGEVAIADRRSTQPSVAQLATLVADAYVGGMLSGKAGVTHFHVGAGDRRLADLRDLLAHHDIRPASLYATHMERSEALLAEAAAISRQGVTVDVDVIDQDLPASYRTYLRYDGDPRRFTASSDAAITGPETLFAQLRACVRDEGFKLEEILPVFTANTADTLRLPTKGRISPVHDADLILVDRNNFSVEWVFAKGRPLLKNGELTFQPRFLEYSTRRIEIYGKKSQTPGAH